ncbi:MAG: hypothetical protein JSS87_09760 [Acidobacteria bacterium]|nr:hypothetical protein [Acidobacteriota bacterium]
MTRFAAAALTGTVLLLSGCHVDANKHGDKKSVDIDVPGASMHIKSDKTPSEAGLGVAVYPGATVDKDNDNANVDMAFGGFKFRMKTVHVSTPDPYDKVKSFYLSELQHYGDVLECRDGKPVGSLQTTGQGLTCEDAGKHKEGTHKGLNFNISSDGQDDVQLKAGSKRHQHIVAIGRKGNGSTMQIVALDFPGSSDEDD